MNIYNRLGALIANIRLDDDSYIQRTLMGECYAELRFSLSSYTEFPTGSYADILGERFTLTQPAQLTKHSTKNIEYTLRMVSYASSAELFVFRNPLDGKVSFDLTATPREHLQMFVDNMNRHDVGWTIGECITSAEKLVTYSFNSCTEALELIASTFDTEWEINGKVVSLHAVEYSKSNPLQMSYGKGNGFRTGVTRDNDGEIPAEYLIPQGSEKNLDPTRYTANTLKLPISQRIGYNGITFSDEVPFADSSYRYYVTDSQGIYVCREGASHVTHKEKSLDCTEIYPSREGTVTSVIVISNGAGNTPFYDVVDNTIPITLDYANYIVQNGQPLQITFQSGQLAGRTFNCSYRHNSIGGTLGRRFEIEPSEYDGVTMPSQLYAPAADDTYIVTNCQLPDSYICDNITRSGASWDMFRKCVQNLYHNEVAGYTFTGDVDEIWAKDNWASVSPYFALGWHIRFADSQFAADGVLMRVTAIKQHINDKYNIELTLTNLPKKTSFRTIVNKVTNRNNVRDEGVWIPMRSLRSIISGGDIVRPSGSVPMVGRINTAGDNFVSQSAYNTALESATNAIMGVLKYNLELIAKGEFNSYSQVRKNGDEVVKVSDKELSPSAPTLKEL